MLVCSVLIISHLESQSKPFQMFTLFFGRHTGVPRVYTNMAFHSPGLCKSLRNTSTNWGFSHDVTKIQTTKLLILLRFYLHDVWEQLKTNIRTNFRSKWVLGFVIDYAWISKRLRDAAFTCTRERAVMLIKMSDLFRGIWFFEQFL